MRVEYYILLPWLVLIPYAVFYLLRANYRANSGLCPECGSRMKKAPTERILVTDMTPMAEKCEACKAKAPASRVKVTLLIVFIVWAFASIGVFRGIAVGG